MLGIAGIDRSLCALARPRLDRRRLRDVRHRRAACGRHHRLPRARYVVTRVSIRRFWCGISTARCAFTIEATTAPWGPVRVLRHGTIDHGEQFLGRRTSASPPPTTPPTPAVGLAIQKLQTYGPMNVGVIGLGSGTLHLRAARSITIRSTTSTRWCPGSRKRSSTSCGMYGRRTKWCWAMRACRSNANSRSSSTFSPWTRFRAMPFRCICSPAQAFALYWRHLKPDGVLAVHVSNRYLSLGPGGRAGRRAKRQTGHDGQQSTDDDEKEDRRFRLGAGQFPPRLLRPAGNQGRGYEDHADTRSAHLDRRLQQSLQNPALSRGTTPAGRSRQRIVWSPAARGGISDRHSRHIATPPPQVENRDLVLDRPFRIVPSTRNPEHNGGA